MEAFREKPDNATYAAQRAGVTPRTAKRAWRGELPHAHMPSIEQTLRGEQDEVRAKAHAEEAARAAEAVKAREVANQARDDRIEQKTREYQASKAALSTALSNLGVLGVLSKPVLMIAQRAAAVLQGKVDSMTYAEALEVLKVYAELSQASSLVAKRSMEIARLAAGEPGKIVGHQHTVRAEAPPVSAERAVEALGSKAAAEQAARDLFAGKLTPAALALIESQTLEEDALRS